MKKVFSILMILALMCTPAFANQTHTGKSTKAKTTHKKAKGASHKKAKTTETVIPQGLEKKEDMPQGLDNQDKTPAGWDQGVKTAQ